MWKKITVKSGLLLGIRVSRDLVPRISKLLRVPCYHVTLKAS